eukprot:CAMPEP_0175731560 /NCGR_PEP_ID=MMETSP0097-20121207/50904_1 /TAXON_ID=311494 /ORGANISM="Alexandrium monilatum, Strain CCMP3105" /LENGTH=136 /DNA_ID=CAMNT_0017039501 /DNA_START=27 /DNA_END=438 /DNA_ORIENTATION=-
MEALIPTLPPSRPGPQAAPGRTAPERSAPRDPSSAAVPLCRCQGSAQATDLSVQLLGSQLIPHAPPIVRAIVKHQLLANCYLARGDEVHIPPALVRPQVDPPALAGRLRPVRVPQRVVLARRPRVDGSAPRRVAAR